MLYEKTDGMIPVRVELARTKSRLLIRMPDLGVTISLHLDDVKIVFDEIPLSDL